jgi:hypothetical protein
MASVARAMPTTAHSPRVADGTRSASVGWLRANWGVDVGPGVGAEGDAGAAQLANVRRHAQAPMVEGRNLATDSCPKPVDRPRALRLIPRAVTSVHVASGDGHALDRMVEHLRRGHAYHISVGDITLGRFEELQEAERMIAARLYRRVDRGRLRISSPRAPSSWGAADGLAVSHGNRGPRLHRPGDLRSGIGTDH